MSGKLWLAVAHTLSTFGQWMCAPASVQNERKVDDNKLVLSRQECMPCWEDEIGFI